MNGSEKYLKVCCKLLELYDVASMISPEVLKNFTTYKSKLYGFSNVHSFDYKDRHYYISDDYSLMDNPQYVQDVLKDLGLPLKGALRENPIPQSDGAKYASGLDGTEYYLWEVSLCGGTQSTTALAVGE